MKVEGGCYCGKVRYQAEGEPMMAGQCHCRECQYITGGGPNMFMAMPATGFTYTAGEPKQFTRKDLDRAVTREFCPSAASHLATRVPSLPAVIVKVGTLDDSKVSQSADRDLHLRQAGLPPRARRNAGVRRDAGAVGDARPIRRG